jgi:putative FmdB family regulatory protein
MPIFEYSCLDCRKIYEHLVIGSDDGAFVCPYCGSRRNEQVPSTFSHAIRSPRLGSYRGVCANAFENFQVMHVHEKNPDGSFKRDPKTGRRVPLRVNSLKELREAEKTYQFSLVIASEDGSNVDDPPTNESFAGDITHGYRRQWAKSPEEWERSMRSDVVKMDVGIAASQKETLAGREA